MVIDDLERFPGGALVQHGLRDLAERRESAEALLVVIGRGRLSAAGVDVPHVPVDDPEIRLYELLALDDPDAAHGRYNALVRQLTSFERAIEAANSAKAAKSGRAAARAPAG